MNILAHSRVLIVSIAFAASVGLAGCLCIGCGCCAPPKTENLPTGPIAPTADLVALPTATIDATSAPTLAAVATAAVNSLIKTGVMYGILSMTDPWPKVSGSMLCNVNNANDGTTTWSGTTATGGTGNVYYSNCNTVAGIGPLNGNINLTYKSYAPSNLSFIADMNSVVLSAIPLYTPIYMYTSANPAGAFQFTGKITFDPAVGYSPIYFVNTDTIYGGQTVIGQPIVSKNNSSYMAISNPPLGALFNPPQVKVRSNVDAAGNWVELQFGRWDIETSQGRPLPASSCEVATPCLLTITDAKGNKATVNVTLPGANQNMVITPVSGTSVTVPITF